MKISTMILSAAAGCALSAVLSPHAAAVVSDDDFNALKSTVQQMDQTMEALKETNQFDEQKIQRLEQRLGDTQVLATNAAVLATNAAEQAEAAQAQATPGPGARHNFMVVGDAEVQFGKTAGQHSGFALADFAPIFLFRANDDILFEAGFDTSLANNGGPPGTGGGSTGSLSLSFAQLDYLWNDYVTLVAGDMLLPLGTYNERSAGWLTKIPDSPLLDQNILSSSGVGVQLRGAVPVGDSGQMLTYAVYGANGPGSTDGTGTAGNLDLGGNVGILGDGTQQNLHSNPSGGGRIGWFYPWKPHYDVELGVSGQSGEWDDAGKEVWSASVLDAAIHISPYFEAKGEYAYTWYGTSDMGTIIPRGWWMQAAYKLAGLDLDLPVVSDVELVGRYDRLTDGLGTKTDRYTAGFIYYFTNTLLFEGDYEYVCSRGPAAMPPNDFILQLSYGF